MHTQRTIVFRFYTLRLAVFLVKLNTLLRTMSRASDAFLLRALRLRRIPRLLPRVLWSNSGVRFSLLRALRRLRRARADVLCSSADIKEQCRVGAAYRAGHKPALEIICANYTTAGVRRAIGRWTTRTPCCSIFF